MPTANKFAVLSDVNEKKKQIVVSDNLKPKKDKPKGEAAAAKPAAAGKPAAAKPAAQKKAPAAKKAAAPGSDAPTDLRAAAEFNRKKAEELAKKKAAEEEARAVAQRAAAEVAAVKEASEEAQAEVQGDADAAKEAADEAAAVAAEVAPVKEEPAKPVMTLADYNKARAESKFAIGSKAARAADASALKSLQKVQGADDELVIKKAAEQKPVNTKAKKNVAPAPKLTKKDKAEKIDLTQFADFSAPRGRGGYRGDGERGRGRGGAEGERGRGRGGADGERGRGRGGAEGERGRGRGGERGAPRGGFRGGAGRVPNPDDKRSFPTL